MEVSKRKEDTLNGALTVCTNIINTNTINNTCLKGLDCINKNIINSCIMFIWKSIY